MSKKIKNKLIKDFLATKHKLEIVKDIDEGGYVAYYPSLPGCVTIGKTKKQAKKTAKDAKRAWFEAVLETKQ
jgi:hypothetical protein